MNKLETIQLLQIHRTNLNQKLNYPGWNIWALAASLAGLLWFSINIISKSTIEWRNTMNLFLFFIFVFSALEMSIKFFNIPIRKLNSNDPTHYFSRFGATSLNPQLFLSLFFWSSIFYLVNFKNYLTGTHELVFNSLFYLLIVVYILFIVVVNLQIIPIPQNSKRNNKTLKNFIFWGIIIIFLVIAHGFYNNLPRLELISVTTLKIGLLFYGLFFVIKTFIGIKRYTPLIIEIDKLIDDLTFDIIISETAIKKLRLIINGLSFKDIISPQLTKLLHLNRKFDEICDRISNTSRQLDSVYDSENKIDERKVELIFESISQSSDLLIQLIEKIKKSNSKIIFKLNVFLSDQKDTVEFNQVMEEIQSAKKKNMTKIAEVKDSYENIKSDLDEKREKQHITKLYTPVVASTAY